MIPQGFALKPFPGKPTRFPLEITGVISRPGHNLALCYELRGDLSSVVLPWSADRPARRDGLWEETCFELFLAPKNPPHYWELNLSPAGHWNLYRFQAYRQGMQEEPVLASLLFTVKRQSSLLVLILNVNLATIIPAGQPLDAAISSVIKGKDGELTYWALTHTGLWADFHRRDSFIIEL